jgi:hypothetical protein
MGLVFDKMWKERDRPVEMRHAGWWPSGGRMPAFAFVRFASRFIQGPQP